MLKHVREFICDLCKKKLRFLDPYKEAEGVLAKELGWVEKGCKWLCPQHKDKVDKT